MTSFVEFGPPGPSGMPSNAAFYINGKTAERACDVRVKVNINNHSTRKEAFAKLKSATETLFRAAGQPMPAVLVAALQNERQGFVQVPFGVAELIHESGRIDGYKVVLTDMQVVAKAKAETTAAASGFERCKGVVARAVGYSSAALTGDGAPTQESGYQSFLLTGQRGDLFFCEVHPGNAYRVKAALAGKFPFRPLVEGKF